MSSNNKLKLKEYTFLKKNIKENLQPKNLYLKKVFQSKQSFDIIPEYPDKLNYYSINK